ncbi:MAG TPA: PilZ domain-containing protein [Burkholderiaceae bacterium]
MTPPSDDLDALFGTPAAPAPSAKSSGGATPHPSEARKEQRVKVSWPARVQLPGGRVVELRVRDLSESGVGLLTDVNIPAYTVLNFAMAVPGLHEGSKMTPVSGTIKTTYIVIQGRDLCCGGMWVQLPESSRELLNKWIRRLRK